MSIHHPCCNISAYNYVNVWELAEDGKSASLSHAVSHAQVRGHVFALFWQKF